MSSMPRKFQTKMRLISVHVPEKLLEVCRKLVEDGLFTNVSELIRLAITELVARLSQDKFDEVKRLNRCVELCFKSLEECSEVVVQMPKRLTIKNMEKIFDAKTATFIVCSKCGTILDVAVSESEVNTSLMGLEYVRSFCCGAPVKLVTLRWFREEIRRIENLVFDAMCKLAELKKMFVDNDEIYDKINQVEAYLRRIEEIVKSFKKE